MEQCNIEGCSRTHYIKGLCNPHYLKDREKNSTKKCIKGGCNRGVYAKGLCKTHYNNKDYVHKTKQCLAPGCEIATIEQDYCARHDKRAKKGHPLDLNIDTRKGEYNVNWGGGVSEYKDHSLMKKMRKQKKDSIKKCEVCHKRKPYELHHKDRSKSNHVEDNFLFICRQCHCALHPKTTSIYTRLYGMTLKEMANKYGYSTTWLCQLHKKEQLEQFFKRKGHKQGKTGISGR